MYECRYVYTNRKTVAIRVLTSEMVEVRAPRCLSRSRVRDFVARSADWIERQVADRRRSEAQRARFLSDRMLWNGVEIPVLTTERKRAAMTENGFEIPADADPRATVAAFLRRRAKIALPKLCRDAAERYGFPAAEVGITSAVTQWGNCDGRRIRLHYTLVCLPKRLRDYVVLHELTHLEHLDHSAAFWNALTARIPDAKARRAELKNYAWLLGLYRRESE